MINPTPISEKQECFVSCFSSNMVLQRNMPIAVWGKGYPGTSIRVSIATHSQSVLVDEKGNWHLHLPALCAGGPYELIMEGNRHIVLHNVMIGEVWLCSGQSNIEFKLCNEAEAESHLATANNPDIRLLNIPASLSIEPQNSIPTEWKVCTRENAIEFSAIGYIYGCQLSKKLGVPIGIISSSYGGSVLEAWIPPVTLNDNPVFSPILSTWERWLLEYPSDRKNVNEERKIVVENWKLME